MPINAILSVDGGQTLNETTTFEVRPEIGERISFWKDGREPLEAIVASLKHHQVEHGFIFVVEATTGDVDGWVRSLSGSE